MRQLSEKRLVEARVNHLAEHVAWCEKVNLPVSQARSAQRLEQAQARLAALKAGRSDSPIDFAAESARTHAHLKSKAAR